MQYKHFSVEEREAIQQGIWGERSMRSIAKEIERSPSSVIREIKRNLPKERFLYTPRLAHERAVKQRKSRGRKERLKNQDIRDYVVNHLKRRWSPEQISGKIHEEIGERISHEAIYQYVYSQLYQRGHGYLKPGCLDLRMFLRRRRKRRIPKGARRSKRVWKPDFLLIQNRPQEVNLRERVGDWEGDTIESADRKPGLNTLVERKTGVVMITKLGGKDSNATIEVMKSRFEPLPQELKHTITLDNGPENSNWQAIEKATSLKCFFANAYHSWERGTNENTNGLIRDYFPKKTDFDTIRDEELAFVEGELNNRPRKRLGWKTPIEALSVALQG